MALIKAGFFFGNTPDVSHVSNQNTLVTQPRICRSKKSVSASIPGFLPANPLQKGLICLSSRRVRPNNFDGKPLRPLPRLRHVKPAVKSEGIFRIDKAACVLQR